MIETTLTQSELNACACLKTIFNKIKQRDGITVKSLAEQTDIKPVTFYKFLNFERAMTEDYIYRLASVLNVSPLEIKPDFDLDGYVIREELKQLDKHQKSLVLQFIQSIK